MRINDDLNGSFLRYERYERGMNFQKNGAAAAVAASNQDSLSPSAAAATAVAQAKPEIKTSPNNSVSVAAASGTAGSKLGAEKSLIDFEEDEFDPLSKSTKIKTSNESISL